MWEIIYILYILYLNQHKIVLSHFCNRPTYIEATVIIIACLIEYSVGNFWPENNTVFVLYTVFNFIVKKYISYIKNVLKLPNVLFDSFYNIILQVY